MSKCKVVWHCKMYVSYSICESGVILCFLLILTWSVGAVDVTYSYHFVDRDGSIELKHPKSKMNWSHLLLVVINWENWLCRKYFYQPLEICTFFKNLFYLIQSWVCIISEVSHPDLLAKVIKKKKESYFSYMPL